MQDMYSIGAIFYEMLFGCHPFFETNLEEQLKLIKSGEINFSKGSIKISEQAQDFIKQLLNYDPGHRIELSKLLDHPLLKQQLQDQLFKPIENEGDFQQSIISLR